MYGGGWSHVLFIPSAGDERKYATFGVILLLFFFLSSSQGGLRAVRLYSMVRSDPGMKASKKELYARVTEWGRLPGAVKMLLCTSTFIITVSYWAILIGPSFLPPETMIRDYVLTDCISVKLEGKFWTVVTMTGWFFLALFGLSCVLLWVFGGGVAS